MKTIIFLLVLISSILSAEGIECEDTTILQKVRTYLKDNPSPRVAKNIESVIENRHFCKYKFLALDVPGQCDSFRYIWIFKRTRSFEIAEDWTEESDEGGWCDY